MSAPTFRALAGTQSTVSASLESQLCSIHAVIRARYPGIERVALAPYEAQTDALRTLVSSNMDGARLDHYEAKLKNVPSLCALAEGRMSRVVDDIPLDFGGSTPHTEWLKVRDYRSSFTVPIFRGEGLAGFLFFDSKQPRYFDADMTGFLEVFAQLISQLYALQLQVVHGMVGTVQLASGLATIRDLETGQHLQRMAAYSRLMAVQLADKHDFTDEFIEYVHLFAPLHDIGKVGVPDNVLLKPGKLDAAEWIVMRRHVEIGESIVIQMGRDLQIGNGLAIEVMRNIVAGHHERGDGSGYPRGLVMAQIPFEARIVAVADVYDALSNVRPYKRAWTEEKIVQELDQEASQGKLDGECVQVLMSAALARTRIRQEFVG